MKPILFNTEMVRALLDGRKTCTRRVVKPQPPATSYVQCTDGKLSWAFWQDGDRHWIKSPFDPGDILYVRETWTMLWYTDQDGYTHFDMPMYYYAADGTPDITLVDGDGFELDDQRIRWHPNIHMPKEIARIFLRVTDVRVERLQDITEDGVCEEGAEPLITCKCEHTIYYPEGGIEACWNTGCCSYCPEIEESYADHLHKYDYIITIYNQEQTRNLEYKM